MSSKNGRREADPAFQFYAADFLASDSVALLDNAGIGMLIKLMARSWVGDGLPVELAKLARLVNESEQVFEQTWNSGLADCFEERDGRLYNRRLEAERERRAEYRAAKAEAGRKSGEARRRKKAADDPEKADSPPPEPDRTETNTCSIPFEQTGNENEPPAQPSPAQPNTTTPQSPPAGGASPEKPKRGRRATVGKPELARLCAAEALPEPVAAAAEEWRAFRAEAGLKPWQRATWTKQLTAAARAPDEFVASVEHSIANGYQGIHPPKNGRPTPAATNKTRESKNYPEPDDDWMHIPGARPRRA